VEKLLLLDCHGIYHQTLDSMCWFSHWRRTGGRHNCVTYLLMPSLPCPHPFVDFLHSDSANRHILGCGDPGMGPMTPKLKLGGDFCTVHITAKFHHPTFNRLEVIVLINKQMPLKTFTSLCCAMLVGNIHSDLVMVALCMSMSMSIVDLYSA